MGTEVIKAVTNIYVKLSDETFENAEEMDDFPAKSGVPKFTQEERMGKPKYTHSRGSVRKRPTDLPLKRHRAQMAAQLRFT